MPGVLPFIGIALGLGGAAVSYNAQMNAADTAQTFANLNAQAGAQQAHQQASVQALQAQIQGANQQAQQQSAYETATAQQQQAEMDAKAQQENIRRGRDEFLRELSAVQAQTGASGAILSSGSPIDMLMAASDAENQQEQDAQYQINAGRAAGFRKAAETRLAGRGAGANASLYQLQALSAVQSGRDEAAQARLGGMAGAANAQGMRNAAMGGLISSFGSIASRSVKSSNPWGAPKASGYVPKRY